jgi:hypothetical protein
MGLATTEKNGLLDHWMGHSSYTPKTTFYVGLSTTTPTESGSGVTEPSGGAYARVAVTKSNFLTAASGELVSNSHVTFPEATADWGTCTHFVIYDAATAGNFMDYGKLVDSGDNPTSLNVVTGYIARILSGRLKIRIQDGDD